MMDEPKQSDSGRLRGELSGMADDSRTRSPFDGIDTVSRTRYRHYLVSRWLLRKVVTFKRSVKVPYLPYDELSDHQLPYKGEMCVNKVLRALLLNTANANRILYIMCTFAFSRLQNFVEKRVWQRKICKKLLRLGPMNGEPALS